MRLLATAILVCLAGTSALGQVSGAPLDTELQSARAQQAAAEAQTAKLEKAADQARTEADRIRAQRAAAAQAIEAAEARITAAQAQLRIASAYVAAHRQQLAAEQQPVSALLAGLALMADRPPLLTLADQGGIDELVRVRILLGSTLPVIRSRTARLSAQLSQGQRLQQAAVAAQRELAESRNQLIGRQQQFAALEQKANALALASGAEALSSGDVAIAAGEDVERLRAAQAATKSIRAVADQLAFEDVAPPSPFAAQGQAAPPPFRYRLPSPAPVSQGLAEVNESGVRARGIMMMTARGATVAVPADGRVRFSGPFKSYDGIVIIDHGGGWLSVLVNVSSTLRAGDTVRLGDALGRALGPIELELSHNGQWLSPAIIAGSSPTLSKGIKGG